MDSQKILETAIREAIDGGWIPYDAKTVSEHTYLFSVDYEGANFRVKYPRSLGKWVYFPTYELIFNHDFAKALWGEEPGIGAVPGFIDDAPNWQYHLMLMVIAEDPIAYLGENI